MNIKTEINEEDIPLFLDEVNEVFDNINNAEIFFETYRNCVAYDSGYGWVVWTGKRWHVTNSSNLFNESSDPLFDGWIEFIRISMYRRVMSLPVLGLDELPNKPGVYFLTNGHNRIIYVGMSGVQKPSGFFVQTFARSSSW